MPGTDAPMLKTYRALSMAAALAEVKKDLGADAVIVNTRTLRSGGVLGVGARNIIEITATAGSPRPRAASPARGVPAPASTPPPPRRTPVEAVPVPAAPTRAGVRAAAQVEPRVSTFTPTTPRPLQAALADRAAEPAPRVRVENAAAQQARPVPAAMSEGATAVLEVPGPAIAVLEAALPEPPPSVAGRITTPVRVAPIDDTARVAIEEELASIKRLVAQVLQTSRQTAARVQAGGESHVGAGGTGLGGVGVSTPPLMAMSVRLLDAQLAPDLTDVLLGKVRDELSPQELADETIVREAVLRHLASAIPIAPDSTLRRSDSGRPLTLALVGPTGVGKTTTVAKLAAALKLRHAKKVGLVTSDTYRIAAVEQLRTYANIIGLPLKVALTPEDMRAACEAMGDCDIILVDTAGRSQHDAQRLDELRHHRDAAQPHQTHLVLSAAASESVLLRAADRFKPLAPDRLLVTKLDEAVTFGPIVNVAARIGLGLSFVTTGQEVPDHIERARADRLARLVLDGGGVR